MDSELEQFTLEDVAEEEGEGRLAVGGQSEGGVRRRARGRWDSSSSGSEDECGGGGRGQLGAAGSELPKGPLKTQASPTRVPSRALCPGARIRCRAPFCKMCG